MNRMLVEKWMVKFILIKSLTKIRKVLLETRGKVQRWDGVQRQEQGAGNREQGELRLDER